MRAAVRGGVSVGWLVGRLSHTALWLTDILKSDSILHVLGCTTPLAGPQEKHYQIVSAPTPFIIGLPDMESIAEHTAYGGTAQVAFLEVPPTHGGRRFGRFIDAEDLQHDQPIRAMVCLALSPNCRLLQC